MTKPPPQTKEQIEGDIAKERQNTLNDFGRQMTMNLMTELPIPVESIQVAMMVLGAIVGNTVVLNDTAMNELLKEIFGQVERHARSTATARANMEAIIGGPDGQVR